MSGRRIAKLAAAIVVYVVAMSLVPGIDDVPLVTVVSIQGLTAIYAVWVVLDD